MHVMVTLCATQTSASTGAGVEEAFMTVAQGALELHRVNSKRDAAAAVER
jgi:hypothetical protein